MKSSLSVILLISAAATSASNIEASARRNLDPFGVRPFSIQSNDINRADETGLTPLMHAAQDGDSKEIKSLIEKGANVNETDRYGWTALNYSIAQKDESKSKLLINRGANVNTKDRRDITPLMWAAYVGKAEVVKLLLSKGAEINATARNGATALSFAIAKDHKSVIDLLKKAGGTGPQLSPDDVPEKITPVDKSPKLLNQREGIPRYTEEARRNGVGGVVRLRVLFGTDGTVKKIKVISGLPYNLTEEAVRATYKLRAEPAMLDGRAIEYWVAIQLSFDIR